MKPIFSPLTEFNCPYCAATVNLDTQEHVSVNHGDRMVCRQCEGEIVVPAAFEDYLIFEKISSDPHCTKYRALNQSEGRVVILKVLNQETEERMKAAHLDMHRRLATQMHPNLNLIFRFDQVDDVHFVEEQWHARCLRDLIYARTKQSEVEALTMIRDVASAIAVIHAQLGINHLNISPKSIRLDEAGVPIVSDFCHHRIGEPERKLIGVAKYASPESILFASYSQNAPPPGPQADVFSLGIVLYRLLSKRSPYRGDPMQMLKARFTEKPKPLSDHVNLTTGTLSIVERMMTLKLTERYPSMLAVFEAINDQIVYLGESVREESTTDIQIHLIEEESLGNDDSGQHAFNQQALTEAVDDLYQAGALEYAAPADESRIGLEIAQFDSRTADTQKVEINKTDVVIPKAQPLYQSQVKHGSESESESEADMGSDQIFEELEALATPLESESNKVDSSGVQRSARSSRSARLTSQPDHDDELDLSSGQPEKSLLVKAICAFFFGMAGGVCGFFLMDTLTTNPQQKEKDDAIHQSLPVTNQDPVRPVDKSIPLEAGEPLDATPVDAFSKVNEKVELPDNRIIKRMARKSVIEAEILNPKFTDGAIEIYERSVLSGGRMLLWVNNKSDERLTLYFSTHRLSQSLVLGIVRHVRFGRFDIYLNDRKIAENVNLYASKDVTNLELIIETKFEAGDHTLVFECVGQASNARSFNLGLDYIGTPSPKRLAFVNE